MKNRKLSAISYQLSAHKGFTLIELLVVIALMSILMLSSISVFFSYTKSQSFQTAISDVVALINKAKSRSLTQVRPIECAAEKALESYQVSFTPLGSDYHFEVLCGGESFVLETKKLPSQVTFAELSASSVVFNISTGTVVVPADVILTGFGNNKTISIDGVGNISVQ
jgi:prepilin-type N-terminal cleavage/methylation domain-containing protein